MLVFNSSKCNKISAVSFSDSVDLILTAAVVRPYTDGYPLYVNGYYLDNDHEMGVLIDFNGNVLTQGF